MNTDVQEMPDVGIVRSRMTRADASLIVVVVATGTAAGFLADPMLWVATPLVAGLLALASRARSPRLPEEAAFLPEFPDALRQEVTLTVDALPPGDARRLLANILQPARSLFAVHTTAFDACAERELRASVSELVAGSCELARELSRLDVATPSPMADARLLQRYRVARELVTSRLGQAAESLSALYASDVEHGTPASDRVAGLVADLRREAVVRAEAMAELDATLR